MSTTYIEAKAILDDVAARAHAAKNRLARGRNEYAVAEAELQGLISAFQAGGAYATFVADLEAAAAADSWPQADAQLAEKDQMASEIVSLRNQVQAILAAIDGV